MLPSANDLKAWNSLSILKWCDFILVLRSCDIKCYNNHYLATNSNFSSEKARLKTVNPSLAAPPSSFFCWVSDHPVTIQQVVQRRSVGMVYLAQQEPWYFSSLAMASGCPGPWEEVQGYPLISEYLHSNAHGLLAGFKHEILTELVAFPFT